MEELSGRVDNGGYLAHAREGRGSFFDSMIGVSYGRCRVDGCIEAVEEEGVEDLENNVHGSVRCPTGAVFCEGGQSHWQGMYICFEC